MWGGSLGIVAGEGWEQRVWLARVRTGPGQWTCGAGFLVDARHAVTCAHVVQQAGAAGPGGRVFVDFPQLADAGCWAEVLADGWAEEAGTRGDTAVLRLADPPAGACPVPVRAVTSVRGQEFAAYGFPASYAGYGDAEVASQGRLGLAVGREWVQLEVASSLLVEPGYSGGAVWNDALGAVVALLVTRDAGTAGRVAFAVPMRVLAQRSAVVAAALPTALELDPAREGHWLPRARGGTGTEADERWLFTGRQRLLRELVGWLTSPEPPGQRVVTGTPGSGKSAVLARLVTTADRHYRARVPGLRAEDPTVPPANAVDVTFVARGAYPADLCRQVAAVLDLPDGAEPDRLVAALRPRLRETPIVVVVDGVDEAADPPGLICLLNDLAAGGARVLVGCREHLRDELADPDPMRVDRAPYLDLDDVVGYVHALLAPAPGEPAAPVRAAAASDGDVAETAEEIAAAAEGNFLVAQLVARSIRFGGGVGRPFPREVHQAFDRLLRALPGEQQVRDLLLPLAYARGDGLPADEVWLSATAALRGPYRRADLEDLLASPAAAFLTTATASGDGRRYRLFHQALGEALTRARDPNDDARRLWHSWQTEVLPVDERGRPDWALAPVYLRRHAGEHAATAGELPQLLDDAGYLAVTDLTRLLPLLPPGTPAGDTAAGVVLRRIGMRADPASPVRRAQLLALTAAHLGLHDLHRRLVAARPLPVRVQWAHSLGVPHHELTGHTGRVRRWRWVGSGTAM